MRIILSLAIIALLSSCQTTKNKDTELKTSNNSDKVSTGKTDYIYPQDIAKRATNVFASKHAITSGLFTQYDPQTLDELAKESTHFDEPGKAIPYRSYVLDLSDLSEKNEAAEVFDKLKRAPNVPVSYIAFFEKLQNRVLNITEEEISQTSLCMADYTWEDFSADHKSVFNKMALGTELTSEETKIIKINVPTNRKDGRIPKTIKCMLASMELLNELKTRFRL